MTKPISLFLALSFVSMAGAFAGPEDDAPKFPAEYEKMRGNFPLWEDGYRHINQNILDYVTLDAKNISKAQLMNILADLRPVSIGWKLWKFKDLNLRRKIQKVWEQQNQLKRFHLPWSLEALTIIAGAAAAGPYLMAVIVRQLNQTPTLFDTAAAAAVIAGVTTLAPLYQGVRAATADGLTQTRRGLLWSAIFAAFKAATFAGAAVGCLEYMKAHGVVQF